jgi:phosphoglycolate phosphatase
MPIVTCQDREFAEIEAIVFDKDGTLQDSRVNLIALTRISSRSIEARIPGTYGNLLAAAGLRNNELDPAGLMAVGSRAENIMAAAACIAIAGCDWVEAKHVAEEAFEIADLEMEKLPISPLFEGVLDALVMFARAGLKLAVLSAATSKEVDEFVRGNRLEGYFDFWLGVDGEITKPDPQLLWRVCERIGADPANTLVIGDAQTDIQMARNAGAAGVIGIDWHGNFTRLTGADAIVDRLSAIQVNRSRSTPP